VPIVVLRLPRGESAKTAVERTTTVELVLGVDDKKTTPAEAQEST
jgi:hypothetical protein